jgi:hypothetical protein
MHATAAVNISVQHVAAKEHWMLACLLVTNTAAEGDHGRIIQPTQSITGRKAAKRKHQTLLPEGWQIQHTASAV